MGLNGLFPREKDDRATNLAQSPGPLPPGPPRLLGQGMHPSLPALEARLHSLRRGRRDWIGVGRRSSTTTTALPSEGVAGGHLPPPASPVPGSRPSAPTRTGDPYRAGAFRTS
ncbi:hypothetical protein ACP70R_016901 [Stipagrostis hirtigluma subsp. patula]